MATNLTSFDRFGDLVWIGAQGPIHRYAGIQMYRRTDVLLKIVRPPLRAAEVGEATEAQKRLLMEAITTDRVTHPNVVRVIDAGISRDLASFIAIEWLEGEDLAEHLQTNGHISVPNAIDMATGLARALGAAHARGVVHGDVCPRHVFLLENGGVKLTGFGRGHAPSTDSLRAHGRAQGTPGYMCPRYAATGALDERSDLYSLGVTLYEAISGRNPVAAPGHWALSEPSLELRVGSVRAPIPLCELVPGVVPELSREIHRAMARKPEERHRSVEEFLEALEHQFLSCALRGPVRGPSAVDHDSPTVPVGIVAARRSHCAGKARLWVGPDVCEQSAASEPTIAGPRPGEEAGARSPQSPQEDFGSADDAAMQAALREVSTISEIRAGADARRHEATKAKMPNVSGEHSHRTQQPPQKVRGGDSCPGGASSSRSAPTAAAQCAASCATQPLPPTKALRNDATLYGVPARPRFSQAFPRAVRNATPPVKEAAIVTQAAPPRQCGRVRLLIASLVASLRAVFTARFQRPAPPPPP